MATTPKPKQTPARKPRVVVPPPKKVVQVKTPRVVAKQANIRKKRLDDTTGFAESRSKKVADDYAAGKRAYPEEIELRMDATPLDVMIMAMRRAYLIGGSIYAAPFAEKAAPYLHGKISTIELKNPKNSESGKTTPFRVEFVDPEDDEGEDNAEL